MCVRIPATGSSLPFHGVIYVAKLFRSFYLCDTGFSQLVTHNFKDMFLLFVIEYVCVSTGVYVYTNAVSSEAGGCRISWSWHCAENWEVLYISSLHF